MIRIFEDTNKKRLPLVYRLFYRHNGYIIDRSNEENDEINSIKNWCNNLHPLFSYSITQTTHAKNIYYEKLTYVNFIRKSDRISFKLMFLDYMNNEYTI